MPTPLPDTAATKLEPPDADESEFLARGIASAMTAPAGITDLQRLIVEATVSAMTGFTVDVASLEPIDAEGFAQGLAARNEAFRTRMFQVMRLGALVMRPLPTAVAEQIGEFARTADWSPTRSAALHTSAALQDAWSQSVNDAALAEQWAELGRLPPNTIGRRMFEFFEARGFEFPGRPGSAPPLLAQHDWVHVLADYGTRVESELEVFAFIARANDDPRGFSLLAMVISLFETGYLRAGAGLFEAFPGQLSQAGMAVRVADAMRRGALTHGLGGAPDVDFMAVDWFALASRPVEDLRAEFAIPPKSRAALDAGSVGPWEPGGISDFQWETAQARAAAPGVNYESYGAAPSKSSSNPAIS